MNQKMSPILSKKLYRERGVTRGKEQDVDARWTKERERKKRAFVRRKEPAERDPKPF